MTDDLALGMRTIAEDLAATDPRLDFAIESLSVIDRDRVVGDMDTERHSSRR
jgi:hypothetical protein